MKKGSNPLKTVRRMIIGYAISYAMAFTSAAILLWTSNIIIIVYNNNTIYFKNVYNGLGDYMLDNTIYYFI